ncbi:MAG: hypothetical protein ACKOXM_01035 [Agromyces sp.]
MGTKPESISRLHWNSVLWPSGSGILAWLIWMWASYLDAQQLSSTPYGEPMPGSDRIDFSALLHVLALAILGAGAFIGRRLAIMALRDNLEAASRQSLPVYRFTTTVVAGATILTAIAAIAVFMTGFGGGHSGEAASRRLLEVYLPIIGFTAVVVFLLVTLFTMRAPKRERATMLPEAASPDAVAKSSLLALAFSIPIVATAIGMTTGLLVFDLTNRAPEVTVWLLIMAFIGAGLVAGSILSARALNGLGTDSEGYGAGVAARRVNFVLSIVFVLATLIMSTSYGQSAMSKLTMNASLNVNLYDSGSAIELDVSGYALQRNASVTATLTPPGEVVLSGDASADGQYYDMKTLTSLSEPGDYTLRVESTASDGAALVSEQTVTVSDDGHLTGSKGTAVANATSALTPDGAWIALDFLPPLGLLVLAESVAVYSLFARNRRLD